MIPVHVSQNIVFPAGNSSCEIDTERDLQLTFRCRENCAVFVRVTKAKDLRIRGFFDEGVHASVLFWNVSEEEVHFDESYEVMRDADVTVAYGECAKGNTQKDIHAVLRQSGARFLLSSASLVSSRKHYNMRVVNDAPHTYGEMKNYAVVLDHGDLMIDAIGQILKGAYRSENHQTSRAMSFEEGQRSEILPELLIDENDVQASHAMSIGRMDEDQLYYMMSRGLSMKECTSLVSSGYLMPIADIIEDEELKQILREELERKIAESCSM